MDLNTWLPFFFATVAISLSPGPGALAAMSAGLSHGARQGQRIAYGLALGVWTQLAIVGVGLGALLATSGAAFMAVKWLGVAYLVYLGVQQWRSPVRPWTMAEAGLASQDASSLRALVWRGWTVNALNPKGTVFLLAVMPQFLDLSRPLGGQYLTIGATFGVVEFTVMSAYVMLAARVLGLLRTPRQQRWMNRGFGGLFVMAGAALAMFKRGA